MAGQCTDSELFEIRLTERDIDSLAARRELGMVDPEYFVSAWRRTLTVLGNDSVQHSGDCPVLAFADLARCSGF